MHLDTSRRGCSSVLPPPACWEVRPRILTSFSAARRPVSATNNSARWMWWFAQCRRTQKTSHLSPHLVCAHAQTSRKRSGRHRSRDQGRVFGDVREERVELFSRHSRMCVCFDIGWLHVCGIFTYQWFPYRESPVDGFSRSQSQIVSRPWFSFSVAPFGVAGCFPWYSQSERREMSRDHSYEAKVSRLTRAK